MTDVNTRLMTIGDMAAKYVNENSLTDFLAFREAVGKNRDAETINEMLLHAIGTAATVRFFKEIQQFVTTSEMQWCLARATEHVCDRWEKLLREGYLKARAEASEKAYQEILKERPEAKKKGKSEAKRPTPNKFGAALRLCRLRRGFTQKQVSELTNYSGVTIHKYETSPTPPKLKIRKELVRKLKWPELTK